MMNEPKTVEERLARIEEVLFNHVLHGLRTLDAKLWAVLLALVIALLGIFLK